MGACQAKDHTQYHDNQLNEQNDELNQEHKHQQKQKQNKEKQEQQQQQQQQHEQEQEQEQYREQDQDQKQEQEQEQEQEQKQGLKQEEQKQGIGDGQKQLQEHNSDIFEKKEKQEEQWMVTGRPNLYDIYRLSHNLDHTALIENKHKLNLLMINPTIDHKNTIELSTLAPDIPSVSVERIAHLFEGAQPHLSIFYEESRSDKSNKEDNETIQTLKILQVADELNESTEQKTIETTIKSEPKIEEYSFNGKNINTECQNMDSKLLSKQINNSLIIKANKVDTLLNPSEIEPQKPETLQEWIIDDMSADIDIDDNLDEDQFIANKDRNWTFVR